MDGTILAFIDDCRNIAKVVRALVQRGAVCHSSAQQEASVVLQRPPVTGVPVEVELRLQQVT